MELSLQSYGPTCKVEYWYIALYQCPSHHLEIIPCKCVIQLILLSVEHCSYFSYVNYLAAKYSVVL